jgi:hypothetical protein
VCANRRTDVRIETARNLEYAARLKSVGYGENEQACMADTRGFEHPFGHGISTKRGHLACTECLSEARFALHYGEGHAGGFEKRSNHATDAAIADDYDMIAPRVARELFE